jgi:hypothetical protein
LHQEEFSFNGDRLLQPVKIVLKASTKNLSPSKIQVEIWQKNVKNFLFFIQNMALFLKKTGNM